MSSDDESYSRKADDDDRTLYLRRTGFGHAGRSILAAPAPKMTLVSSPTGSKMLAPRFGAQGDPLRGSRDYSDDDRDNYDMDEMDEQNMSSEFEVSPPRDNHRNDSRRSPNSSRSSPNRNASPKRGEGKTQDDNSSPTKAKILPPPKMPPPKGTRNASAARLQFAKAPPKGGKPSGARSAAAKYRAQMMKKKSGRSEDAGSKFNEPSEAGGKRADVGPPPRRQTTPTASSSATSSSSFSTSTSSSSSASKTQEPEEIKTLRSSNEVSTRQNDLRHAVRRNDETPPTQRKSRSKNKAHVFGVVSSEDEEEVGRDWTHENAREKAVMSVFSHDWEMQSPEAKKQEQSSGNHPHNPKIHRPPGGGRFAQAMAAQAEWEVDDDRNGGRDGPTISVMEDDDNNTANIDVGDEGDEDEYEERDREYDDYDARRDDDRRRGDDRDRREDRREDRRDDRRDRQESRRRNEEEDDEYEIATDSEEEEAPPPRSSTQPKKMKRGEGKSSTEDDTAGRGNNEGGEGEGPGGEGRKMQDEIDVNDQGVESKVEGENTAMESKSAETKTDPSGRNGSGTSSPSPMMSDLPTGEITVYNASVIPHEQQQLREWLVNPPIGGEEQMVRCFIERDKRGFNRFYPLFKFYVEVEGSAPRLLMYARKLKGKLSGNYLISLDEKDMGKARHKRGDGYIGKLQTSGKNEFTVFDDGVNPNLDLSLHGSTPVDVRRELCVIAYANKSGSNRPTQDRRMEVAIPAIIARPDGQEHSGTCSFFVQRCIGRSFSFCCCLFDVLLFLMHSSPFCPSLPPAPTPNSDMATSNQRRRHANMVSKNTFERKSKCNIQRKNVMLAQQNVEPRQYVHVTI